MLTVRAAVAAAAAPESMRAGVGAGVVEPEQQQQRPLPESMGAGGGADGTAARILAMNQWIPATDGTAGDGAISAGGLGAKAVAATFTTGPQEHMVEPAVTRSRSRSQPLGVSGAFALLAVEEDAAWTIAEPDVALC